MRVRHQSGPATRRLAQLALMLDQKLRLFLGPHRPLLVVMPTGYGVRGLPAPAARAVAASHRLARRA